MTDHHPADITRPLADGTLGDFFAWAFSDLETNTTRGLLGEYLVARAVGARESRRLEWAPWDLTVPHEGGDDTRIEVKTSGRLQVWDTGRPRAPRWDFAEAYNRDQWSQEEANYVPVRISDRVHVWVFALHTCTNRAECDALALDQWEFRVLPHRVLISFRQRSAGVDTLHYFGADPVPYDGLAQAVREARELNDNTPPADFD